MYLNVFSSLDGSDVTLRLYRVDRMGKKPYCDPLMSGYRYGKPRL